MTEPARSPFGGFPHPLALLVICLLAATAATYLVPAGRFERRDDPLTGRRVTVAGTYRPVPAEPVNPFEAMVAVPRGLADGAAVVFYIFLVGGAFGVVDRTGALQRAVDAVVRRLARREILAVPLVGLVFSVPGALMQMQEELIAFVPLLLLLARRLGLDPLTAVAISMGSAAVGAAFSPINPFQVGIAQKLAELPIASAAGFRMVVLAIALIAWLVLTTRYALRTRGPSEQVALDSGATLDWRRTTILGLVAVAFALLVVGVRLWGWEFEQLAALFFVMGIASGLVGGIRVSGTAEAFAEGFRSVTVAALLVGFARAIFVVLEDGAVIDTIVNGLLTPLARLPVAASAVGMMAAHALIHVPVPSTTGQAVLTMPVLVPLSDLLGLSRQVTVLAYQYGAGLCELVTPTNGALLAMLAASGVRFDSWLRFALPATLILALLGVAAIVAAVAVNLA